MLSALSTKRIFRTVSRSFPRVPERSLWKRANLLESLTRVTDMSRDCVFDSGLRELPAMTPASYLMPVRQPATHAGEEEAMKTTLRITAQPAAPSKPFDDSPTAWMADGNCRNYPPATFFPSDGVGVERARAICKGCPVGEQCLEYALEERIEHGVWGGCSERERRRILKRRKAHRA
jgi:WhiB family redox-sensing transcriptional regulator